jgi:hypothetical protein
LNQSAVASYERGTYKIPEMVVTTLSPLLGVDPAYLTFGYPALTGKIWEPPREGKGLITDLATLLPAFWEENRFTTSDRRRFLDGDVVLLSADDGRHCLLFLTSTVLVEAVVPMLPGGHATGSDDCRPSPTLLLRQFSVLDFGVDDLTKEDFQWPDNFGESRWPIEVQRVFTLCIEALPVIFHSMLGSKSQPQWPADINTVRELLRVPLAKAVDRILATEDNAITADVLRKELQLLLDTLRADPGGV